MSIRYVLQLNIKFKCLFNTCVNTLIIIIISYLPTINTRSTAEYKAQKFGAQYAWQSPLLKGNKRERTCPNCPIIIKGPNESKNITVTEDPRIKKFLIENVFVPILMNWFYFSIEVSKVLSH